MCYSIKGYQLVKEKNHSGFLWDLNFGPHASKSDALPTELSVQECETNKSMMVNIVKNFLSLEGAIHILCKY